MTRSRGELLLLRQILPCPAPQGARSHDPKIARADARCLERETFLFACQSVPRVAPWDRPGEFCGSHPAGRL